MTIRKAVIKVGFCVAYDWHLLAHSLPRVYPHSDMICLALDKNRRSWAGQKYAFDDKAFYRFVEEIDTEKKIILYEDDFALPHLNSRQNCNRHRTLIAEKMGKGGWHIQVDADEYFLDFAGFVEYLKKLNPAPTGNEKPLNVSCPFIPLIKKTQKGYLFVQFGDRLPEMIPMATNVPDYQRARQNGHFNHYTPFYVIHETWSRGEEELLYKINNWGHASEELEAKERRLSYFALWKALDEYNYMYLHNFHPAKAEIWPKLGYCEAQNIEELIERIPTPKFPLSKFQLFLKNNRNVARIKHLWNKLLRKS
ncbi:MAG: hypothetical protein KatS3mg033_0564 [Thermonema sp.]|uniref:hypothetical protein n=1 Tax=Thermonema sp. TaxID=2231181 RepID=UPI0021DBE4A7|nr:hypothetical protein [Thermonema sp.]GIV38764.1 MAG: hypothetical protein KatS3mg033_0564 [Thermonema sp.]